MQNNKFQEGTKSANKYKNDKKLKQMAQKKRKISKRPNIFQGVKIYQKVLKCQPVPKEGISLYWCYYPYISKDSVSPVCGIYVNRPGKVVFFY